MCRVCDDTKCLRTGWFEFYRQSSKQYHSWIPTQAGRVGFNTWGRAARFDWIRVFKLDNP